MHYWRVFNVGFLCLIISSSTLSSESKSSEQMKSLTNEARAIVKRFSGTLKPKLIDAMQRGGLPTAIGVCAVEAPKIAEELSYFSGWNVKRVSLKARNQSNASPDTFEETILKVFDERAQHGANITSMEHAEIQSGRFRFMKAQGVEGVCLNCHGKNISEQVKAALETHYPEDTATGYSAGQIRGAFSLIKEL